MKKTISMLLAMVMMFVMCTAVYASSSGIFSEQSITKGGLGDIETKGLTLLGTLQWVGYLVAIGMIIWVGIKYLMSGAGEKAKAKETLIPIVIGAILIAGATWIASTLFTALS